MKIFEKRDDLQHVLSECRHSGETIGLVPTMGNLHEGHLTLIDAARQQCDFVLATIFVNPLQFGPTEDLDKYPRTLEADCKLLESTLCDGVFIPPVSEMYPNGVQDQTLITVPGISEGHCGASRPGHFSGVCTVVCKLFNLTQPDKAFFGEKDYQQLQVIRKMTSDLCIPVDIIGVPTVRMPDGLALSSRNSYLNIEQKKNATSLQESLQATKEKLLQGVSSIETLEREARDFLNASGLKVDYFNISHAQSLKPASNSDTELVILAAAWLGSTRLIDNIRVQLQK